MRLLVISLFSLFISLILVISGNSYLLTLIGVQLGEQGILPSQIGYVMVCYSVGFVAGAYIAPALLQRVGHIRSFAALASLTGMAAISYPLLDSLWTWGILRALGGFAVAALFIAIESWFSAIASNDNRAQLFSMYQIAAYTASAGSQLLIEPGLAAGENVAFTLSGLLLIAAIIPLSISRLQSPPMESIERMPMRRLWQTSALGVLAALFSGILLGSFYALVPLYAALSQVASDQIGVLMSLSIFTAMLLAWPMGWICDRFKRSQVLIITCLIAAVAATFTGLGEALPFYLRVALIAVFMAMIVSIYSISVALTNDLISAEERVGASSTLMLSYGIGSIIGPLAGSRIMESISLGSLFYAFTLILLLLALFARYRQTQLPPLPVSEQEHFIVVAPDSLVAPEFDPRSEETEDIPIETLFPDDLTETETATDTQSEEKP